jgi:arylsulfatase A-like enzyme
MTAPRCYDQSQFLRDVSGTAANNNGVKSARNTFFYSDDDGLLVAMRQGDYKYVFSEQRLQGTMGVWAEPFTTLRLQKIYNLFQDPFERADITSNTFWDSQSRRKRLWDDRRGRQIRRKLQGFPATLVPAELQPRQLVEEMTESMKEARGKQAERTRWSTSPAIFQAVPTIQIALPI